jgi:predicted DNA-binding protein
MTKFRNIKVSKKDQLIDKAVVDMVSNDDAWEKEIEVSPKSMPTSIRLSPRTIQRAKLFARIHHERGYQSWLKKIVEERIETEYEVYKRLQKEVL